MKEKERKKKGFFSGGEGVGGEGGVVGLICTMHEVTTSFEALLESVHIADCARPSVSIKRTINLGIKSQSF